MMTSLFSIELTVSFQFCFNEEFMNFITSFSRFEKRALPIDAETFTVVFYIARRLPTAGYLLRLLLFFGGFG